jgi:predicted nucleotidyltransferase
MLNPFPTVLSTYLFGSIATGFDGADSDVDIAVLLDDNVPSEKVIELRFQLMDLFEDYFGRAVDVVILNNASLKLIHQVLKYGMLLYTREPEKARDFAIQKRKEYFDFKYYIDKDINAMRSFYEY